MKPSIPKGTRDFNPTEMIRRNYIIDSITSVFKRYGFQQIETPAMENISTLTGKYGDEGDQLLYKILNSRIYESREKEKLKAEFDKALEKNSNSEILTERALRYDLTVPFARYVVMHQNEITFPFKRYQVQPVWRADKPQKGRYREFYQCDADVVGSSSLLNEVELIQIIVEVFKRLEVGVILKFNNRKVLTAFAEVNGHPDKIIDLTSAIDKLDKIGIERVKEELFLKGFTEIDLAWLGEVTAARGDNSRTIGILENYFHASEIGKQGIQEIKEVLDYLKNLGLTTSDIELDITLARGLNYYTGAILEVAVHDPRSTFTSSILGGGRYDDLTGIFGLPNVSGVGISFGIDRIYDVMDEMKLFDDTDLKSSSTQVLFINDGPESEKICLRLLGKIREAGINAEIFPDSAVKWKKQFNYAQNKNISLLLSLAPDAVDAGKISVKDLRKTEKNMREFEINDIDKFIEQIKCEL